VKKELVVMIGELLKGTKAEQQLAEVMLERLVLKEDKKSGGLEEVKTTGGLGMPKESTKEVLEKYRAIAQTELSVEDRSILEASMEYLKESQLERLENEYERQYCELKDLEKTCCTKRTREEFERVDEQMGEIEENLKLLHRAIEVARDIEDVEKLIELNSSQYVSDEYYEDLEELESELETLEQMIICVRRY